MSVFFQVGLVIGKGGETIKNMQARTGARIQVCFHNLFAIFTDIILIVESIGATYFSE
jgi:GTPase Era involved in 16S rRNA processing